MAQELDSKALQAAVARELVALRQRLPEWFPTGPYADPLWPMEELDRREAERLARLGRAERGLWHERTRERVAREQERPWREQDRWGLRKRVWKERRDHERELLELREHELLERGEELARQFAKHITWLDELQLLEPERRAWCAELAQLVERHEATLADLTELWQLRRYTAQRAAKLLLASGNLREKIDITVDSSTRDTTAIARAITPVLAESAAAGALPLLPVLFAAIAIEIEHTYRAGLRAEERS